MSNMMKKDNLFPCEKCPKVFKQTGHLNRHIKGVHDEIKDHKCKQCDYGASTSINLTAHIKIMHSNNQDMFSCELCPKTFNHKSNLKVHIKGVHCRIKDNTCAVCDFSASTSSDVKRHTKFVHLNIKEHACNKCNYSCATKQNLESHKNSIHNEISEADKLQCMECGKCFIQRGHFVQHVKTVHHKIRAFKCDICDGKTFPQRSHLNMHIKTVHNMEKDYKCTHCKRAFGYKSNLKKHVQGVHLKTR